MIDRQNYILKDKLTDGQNYKYIDEKQTDKYIDIQTNQTGYRQKVRQNYKYVDSQTNRQTKL